MTRFPTLFRQFILRPLGREKIRAGVAVLGIALGVAVALSIRLANRSSLDAFRAAVDYLGGEASLRIRSPLGRLQQRRLEGLAWLEEFGVASPVIQTQAILHRLPEAALGSSQLQGSPTGRDPASLGPLLTVLGVDVLADLSIRRYRLLQTNAQAREPTPAELLRLLTDPDAVILTQRLAQHEGLAIGDPVELVFGSRRRPFRVRGLLRDEGPGRALDGQIAVMDLAAAQVAADYQDRIDFVDLRLKPALDVDQAQRELRQRLPSGFLVERPDAGLGRTETMIAAFHFNLAALSGIALFVGLFLIYNTVSISVAARRQEIGALQALGSGRRPVLVLFLAEAGLLATLGAIAGLFLGTATARLAVAATAQTVETFYIAQVAQSSASSLMPSLAETLLAVGLTVALAMIAAAVPAWQAASLNPIEVLRGIQRRLSGTRMPRRSLLFAGLLAVAGWTLTRLSPWHGLPVFAFVAELLFALAGALTVPWVLWSICSILRGRLGIALPALGTEVHLAAANLSGALGRIAISVAALSVSLAMMVAISVMVGSFRDTVSYWLDATLRADLLVRPVILNSSIREARIDPAAVAAIRRDPDVVDTGWYQGWQIPYGSRGLRLATADLASVFRQRLLMFKKPHDPLETMASQVARGDILVSESLSLREGKAAGMPLSLPTRSGPRDFTIAGVYYDYASNQGTVLMDRNTYRRFFGDDDPALRPSSISIYLRPGANPETVRTRLTQTVGAGQELLFATNHRVRREALKVFDSTFAITNALKVIAVVIAALGVVSTLITLIYERQQDFAILTLVGGEPAQVRRMVMIEAVLIGAVAQVVGIAVGLVLSLVLIYVVNVQSFGWTIQFHLPLAFLVQTTVLVIAASALCAFYPAIRAANIRAIEVVREE